MSSSARPDPWPATAEEFLATDQTTFGPAWRYELVDGEIIAHAAPSPDHGAIAANVAGTLFTRLFGHPAGCRGETGSGAVSKRRQSPTARIPDVIIRCGEHPRVVFEVLSPSELRRWRQRDRKRLDLQDVAGVREIVEIHQAEAAIHLYRRTDDAWTFTTIAGLDAMLTLESVGVQIPLAEIYRGLELD
jgi:Uma2 family endonuclease